VFFGQKNETEEKGTFTWKKGGRNKKKARGGDENFFRGEKKKFLLGGERAKKRKKGGKRNKGPNQMIHWQPVDGKKIYWKGEKREGEKRGGGDNALPLGKNLYEGKKQKQGEVKGIVLGGRGERDRTQKGKGGLIEGTTGLSAEGEGKGKKRKPSLFQQGGDHRDWPKPGGGGRLELLNLWGEGGGVIQITGGRKGRKTQGAVFLNRS